MFKASFAFVTLAALTLSPIAAVAKDKPAAAPAATATAENGKGVYAPIDYNMQDDRDNILLLDLSNGQRVAIRLMPQWAPNAVERIKTLTRQGFYNGVIFHRVIDGFMAQTGDPTGTGQGGSKLPDLKAEFNPQPHLRGTVAMARAASDDSANSQFYIMFYPRFALDKHYTVFGRVIDNMAAVDEIHRGEPPTDPTRIVQASLADQNMAPPPAPAPGTAKPITASDLNAPIASDQSGAADGQQSDDEDSSPQ
ncbi:peptidylprolyl isomerase [Porphyrobacter algicida]|uniref:Peptidyl-prolyl cis-trans isomerase n=1 Tax=Qipengyuania algicida TaxID=1836209 RepID=A0A845AIB7_9SPHN|nr:peptidylprolyl isomerase [Qipengyuania algicida]MXP28923.1 peptidylprolyl isomerase [Qipengyuania algicida]